MTKLSLFGTGVTVLYFCALGYLLHSNWEGFLQLAPNEWGDFVAGSLGPLAIFWVVLGFFQQGNELKNSVATLELQAKELANSVEQQRELVSVTRETLEHEREAIEQTRVIEKQKLQPKLSFQFGAWSGKGNDNFKYKIKILNSGASVSGFEFVLKREGKVFITLIKDYFDQGMAIERDRDEYLPRLSDGFSGVASFIDRDGDRFEEKFDFVEVVEDGKWPRFAAQRRSHTIRDKS